MKKILALCLSVIMVVVSSSCGSQNHDGEAKTPSGSSVQRGRDYQTVASSFEEKGFTNINLLEIDDLVTGWLTKEGEVEYVSVDGNKDYEADKWYDNDVEVVIAYHVFPDDTKTNQVDDKSSEIEDQVDTEILTIGNCSALSEILSIKSENDPSYLAFAETYNNCVIEFDGCITYMINHEDYDTRYDILISAGNYVDENTANPGPIFKFEDVGIYDLGLTGIELPDFIAVGNNIRVRAEVEEYDSDSGIFELDPILIEAK